MSAFVDNERIEIKVAFKPSGKTLEVLNPDKTDKDLIGYEMHSFWIRKPNWVITRNIAVDATVVGSDGRPMIIPTMIADSRLRRVLLDWTLKDEKDEVVPASNFYIDKLDPELVEHLIGRISEILDAEEVVEPKPEPNTEPKE